jgi:hypothetical protein
MVGGHFQVQYWKMLVGTDEGHKKTAARIFGVLVEIQGGNLNCYRPSQLAQ